MESLNILKIGRGGGKMVREEFRSLFNLGKIIVAIPVAMIILSLTSGQQSHSTQLALMQGRAVMEVMFVGMIYFMSTGILLHRRSPIWIGLGGLTLMVVGTLDAAYSGGILGLVGYNAFGIFFIWSSFQDPDKE